MTALAVTTRMQSIPVESRQTSTFNIFINLIPHNKQKKTSQIVALIACLNFA